MLLVGRRKEPKEEFIITLAGPVADGKIARVRITYIKVDLGECSTIDEKIYTLLVQSGATL